MTPPWTDDSWTQRRAATELSTHLPFSLRRTVRMRLAFVGRAYAALGRSKRHRKVTARIAAAGTQEPDSGGHVVYRLHRCPWCGAQAAYLFSHEVAYPDGAVLSERWQCAHCGEDHTRKR